MTSAIAIRKVQDSDVPFLTSIYNYYIKETTVTFELEAIDEDEMTQRISTISKSYPYIVATLNNDVVGYAYACQWRKRAAYDTSVETTVYVKNSFQSKGIGSALYKELIHQLKAQKFKSAIGGITIPNEASVALHEKHGFKKVGVFTKVGKKFGEMCDVGYWQRDLN